MRSSRAMLEKGPTTSGPVVLGLSSMNGKVTTLWVSNCEHVWEILEVNAFLNWKIIEPDELNLGIDCHV